MERTDQRGRRQSAPLLGLFSFQAGNILPPCPGVNSPEGPAQMKGYALMLINQVSTKAGGEQEPTNKEEV